MTLKDLAELVRETRKGRADLKYSVLKLCAEAGEVASVLAEADRKQIPLDVVGMIDELGDVLWCVEGTCQNLDVSLDTAIEMVYAKLSYRRDNGKNKAEERKLLEEIYARRNQTL